MQIHHDSDLLCLVFQLGYNTRSIILKTFLFSCNIEWLSLAKMQPCSIPLRARKSWQLCQLYTELL